MAISNEKSIGHRIEFLRTKKGVTQQEMADALHVDRVTVSQWELDKRDIKTGNMVSIAEYFNVSCDYLLGRSRAAAPDDFIQEVVTRYGLNEQEFEELSAALNLSTYYEQHKVIDNPFKQFLEAIGVLIRYQSQHSVATQIWRFLFAPIDGVKIIEPPLSVPPEWKDKAINDNANGGERALTEAEVVNYRLLQLNECLLKLRDKLIESGDANAT